MKYNHAADEDIEEIEEQELEEQSSLDRDLNKIKAELAAISNEIVTLKEAMLSVVEANMIMHQTLTGMLEEAGE